MSLQLVTIVTIIVESPSLIPAIPVHPKTNHTETDGLITEITRVRLAAANNI